MLIDFQGGEENLSQAMTTYSELIEKWNPTPLLLNGVASCHMHQLEKKDSLKLAEKELLKALEKVLEPCGVQLTDSVSEPL